MKTPLSSIERLDLAARVQNYSVLISRARIALTILTPLVALLAYSSTAGYRETLLVSVFAGAAFVTTVVLWWDWRFKVYSLAIFCFLFAVIDAISHDHPAFSHRNVGWIASHMYGLLGIYWGCCLLVMAGRYALVNTDGWQKERAQLAEWVETVKSKRSRNIMEFGYGSFWTGYWTYSFFNLRDCWLIAQFKKGNRKLARCRVRDSREVSFLKLPSGKWKIDINGKDKKQSFVEIEIPPQMVPGVKSPDPSV